MKLNNITFKDIDVNFNFTSDTPGYWDGFWDRNGGLGAGGADPDAKSKMARKYHQLLWSKPLPNGDMMKLEDGRSRFYLKWKDFYMGSDSITASFRHWRDADTLELVKLAVPDYKLFVEDYINRMYTIGGMIILPAFPMALNSARGFNVKIRDRWDLTLECIRRHYAGEENPLSKCLIKPINKDFFELFVDFRGFVDYFFLQDLVSEDYTKVNLWLDSPLWVSNPTPKDAESYLSFIKTELDFVEKRNNRIAEYVKSM